MLPESRNGNVDRFALLFVEMGNQRGRTQMSERVALITGGAKGIGREIALALAGRGWSVAVCYRKSKKEATETVKDIESRGARGIHYKSDVSNPASAVDLVRKVEAEFGRIDALINCAGPYHRINLLKESVQNLHEMFDN